VVKEVGVGTVRHRKHKAWAYSSALGAVQSCSEVQDQNVGISGQKLPVAESYLSLRCQQVPLICHFCGISLTLNGINSHSHYTAVLPFLHSDHILWINFLFIFALSRAVTVWLVFVMKTFVCMSVCRSVRLVHCTQIAEKILTQM